MNPAEWLWRNGRAGIRSTSGWSAKNHFRRKAVHVHESPEIKFEPHDILFRSLDRILPA